MPFKMTCPKCHSSDVEITKSDRGLGYANVAEPIFHCRRCGKMLYGKAVEIEYDTQKAAWVEPPSKPQPDTGPDLIAKTAYLEQLREVLFALGESTRHKAQPVQAALRTSRQHWETLGIRRGNDPASLTMNRLEIAVGGAGRLIEEIQDDIEVAMRLRDPRQLHMSVGRVQKKAAELKGALAQIPPLAEAVQQLAPPKPAPVAVPTPTAQLTASCAWQDCTNTPKEGSKYCSRECSNLNARHRHQLRQASPPVLPPPAPAPAPMPQAAHPTKRVSPANGSQWSAFDLMVPAELDRQPLAILRKYARFRLGVVGASKLHGGKPVLLQKILELRRDIAAK